MRPWQAGTRPALKQAKHMVTVIWWGSGDGRAPACGDTSFRWETFRTPPDATRAGNVV